MAWRWDIAQAAEWRWWKRYLKGKQPEEYLHWKRQYWRTLLAELKLDIPSRARCLDAGCGPAGLFMILEQQSVAAVDPLLDRYEEALDHFDKGNYPWVRFVNQPLEVFEPQQPFDFVFCLNAINHVEDLDRCWERLRKAVKPDGTLVVSVDTHNYGFFKHLFRLIPGDVLHPHQYDLKEYQQMVTQGGWTLKQVHLKDQQFFFNYYVFVLKAPAASV